jgi:hypothetical protein
VVDEVTRGELDDEERDHRNQKDKNAGIEEAL